MDKEQRFTGAKRSRLGCFLWAIIVIFLSIALLVGNFYYEIEFKKRTLLLSSSPDHTNTIEIVEKGEPSFFGPSSIRVKSGDKQIDRLLYNDGARPNESNVDVKWNRDNTALITLSGREQRPETIEFNGEKEHPFTNVQLDLKSETVATSISPDQTHMIEIKETIRSQGEKPEEYLTIYYGSQGGELKEYKKLDQLLHYSDQMIEWTSPTHATVNIVRNDKILETMDIEMKYQ
ncbi:hypothetical protein ACM6N5_00235 [Rossellomorea marisflavi]|uniref:hypothetical protein n=1 Tax=Rossellomorea marisflavi TaxID=189381 RepID=UPI003AE6543B